VTLVTCLVWIVIVLHRHEVVGDSSTKSDMSMAYVFPSRPPMMPKGAAVALHAMPVRCQGLLYAPSV
jgi:hypothetical protein